jgi:hypothetical protein
MKIKVCIEQMLENKKPLYSGFYLNLDIVFILQVGILML